MLVRRQQGHLGALPLETNPHWSNRWWTPLVERDVPTEEPVVEAPPTGEEPAVEHPTSGCKWPLDSQEEDRMEVHAPRMILATGDGIAVGACTVKMVGGRRRRVLRATPRESIMIRKLRKCIII